MTRSSPGLLLGLLALAACSRPDVVGVIELPDNRLAAIVAVTERTEVHAEGRCVADDDGETRRLARQGPDTLIDLPVVGLRDDTTWSCTVTVDDGKRTRDHAVALEPTGVPEVLGDYTVEGSTDGYTLLTTWNHEVQHPNVRTVLVDGAGRLRWYRFAERPVISGLDSTLFPTGHVLTGGGPDQPPTWYNPLGDQVQQLGEPPIPGAYHHHVEPVDGGVLTLVNTPNTRLDGSDFTGFAIVWFDPTGQPGWTWSSQEAVDAGTLVPGPDDDAFHANSVSFVTDALGEAAWVSLYAPSQVVRIDRQTGALTHTLGPGGDLALVDPTGAALDPADWFDGQHDPELDGSRMLLLDNGRGPARSRAVELDLDLTANTATLLRAWSEPGWFEPIFGDADRLDDGGWLVARGRCWANCVAEGLPADRVSDVVEVGPDDAVRWRLAAPHPDRGIYRAERVDVCLLWDDPAICP